MIMYLKLAIYFAIRGTGAADGACGVAITGHMHPGQNVPGMLSMRDTHISDTPAAGVCVLSHPAVGYMWSAHFANLTLKNVATTWPTPPVCKLQYKCQLFSKFLIENAERMENCP